MATKDEIEVALDKQLMAAFPIDDLGYPQTDLTRRMAVIVENASILLTVEGFPKLEGYNYHQAGHSVTYNIRYDSDGGGYWVTSGGHTFDNVLSDFAITQSITQWWRNEFNGTQKPIMKG